MPKRGRRGTSGCALTGPGSIRRQATSVRMRRKRWSWRRRSREQRVPGPPEGQDSEPGCGPSPPSGVAGSAENRPPPGGSVGARGRRGQKVAREEETMALVPKQSCARRALLFQHICQRSNPPVISSALVWPEAPAREKNNDVAGLRPPAPGEQALHLRLARGSALRSAAAPTFFRSLRPSTLSPGSDAWQ